ncbi:hypothetical protein JCM1840_005214 [Sporobolomyces johnsonii]
MYRLARACRPALRRPKVSSNPSPAVLALRRTFFWSSSSSSAAAGATDLASSSIPQVSSDLLPLLFGLVLANAVSSDDQETEASPPWKVESKGDKGYGAIAARDIAMGELLIAERPLCIWPQGLSEAQARELFEAMGKQEQDAFMQLARTEGEGPVKQLDEIRARRATNGFAIALPPVPGFSGSKTVAMVFPKIARLVSSSWTGAARFLASSSAVMAHLADRLSIRRYYAPPDCSTPNASQVMNFETLRMEVYPICSIPASTEITIEYLPGMITSTSSERSAALRSSFGFDRCLCSVCSAPPAEVAASDARRLEIKRLSEGLRDGRADRKATLGKMERIRTLLEEEGFKGLPAFGDPSVSNAYAVYATMHARAQREGAGASLAA